MPLQFFKLILLFVTMFFSAIIIFTKTYELLPITTILFGFCFFILALEQRKKAQGNGIFYFIMAVALIAFSTYRIVTSF